MPVPLDGRTALVTGASSGIGAATARVLAGAGARVVLAARRTDRLAALAGELGGAARSLELDVRDPEGVRAALGTLPEEWSAFDVLVNNAGLSRALVPVHENTDADVDDMLDTNVRGLLAVTRAVVPGMVARGRGHVVNLGSIAGHQVYPGGAVYCATKFAVRALSEGLKMDLHGTPIRVTSVDPGMVETEFSEVRFRGDTARASQVYAGTTPLTADDVADAILYAVTRPPHVTVADVVLLPTAQSAATMVARR